MELIGFNGDILMGVTQPSLSAASLQTNIIPNSYGLSIQPNSNSQIASIQFDAATGWLAIAGNANNNIVKQTITGNGYYQFDIDGQLFSSDRSSASFWESLDGATSISVVGIDFDGGLGDDTLIIGSQEMINFGAIADDTIQIQGEVHGESLFFKAKDIINQGSIIAGNVTAEFSNSYSDVADAKIIASNGGNILLNGGKTGDLEATGQFLATGLTGGKINFRGETVNLRGASLDASGENGGGSILIGGDYQGVNSIDSPSLANAESTFVDKYSKIDAGAKNNGNGGKVIIWADIDTDFRGDIKARGGSQSGDGGFVEVSGKQDLNFVGNVDVDAPNGAIGSVLLDPEDIIINPDDDNDETFDVSNLQSIVGGLALSATNSIILNANLDLQPVRGTVTFQAGGTVSLFGNISAPQHNVKITAGAIVGYGSIATSNGTGKAGYVWLESQREIDLDVGSSRILTESGGNSGNIGGNITLKAGTTINAGFLTSAGTIRGGNINILANGDIVASALRSFSNENTGGKIDVVSTSGSINISTYVSSFGLGGRGGAITMTAYGDIISNDIHADSSQIGNGAKVELTSQTGRIDTNGYQISATNTGNAGSVILKAYQDIVVGDIAAFSVSTGNGGKVELTSQTGRIDTSGKQIETSANAGNAGNVVLNAYQDIAMGEIDAYSIIGNGGRAELTSQQQGIKVGNISASSSGDGNGGKVRLTSTSGNIETGSINTSSLTGEGGNVNIEAGGESIKIVNSLSRHDTEYSIYSAGATKNGKINIQQTGETDNYFEVGDATYNGTKGGIYAGLNANGVVNNLLGTTIVVGTYVDGNIKIVTPDSPASLRKAKQLAPEKATLPTTFNPVALSAIQGFIDKGNSALSSAAAQREYRNAIVALDNFRTIEFYQSQGNTSPPVPQLDSVSKIKSFLNAGDIAANTKSAMIYTFLSGTTQDNPYDGTSLNLFAVTSTSDVIYRTIPLINGQYLGLTVKDTVAAFRAGLLDANSEDYKEPASRLYDLIFRPLKDALSLSQVNNLIFSTDSLFRVIPLAALYDKQSSEQNGKFLVEDFSSSVTPSFQVIEKDRYKSLKGANVIKMGATEAGSDFKLLPSVQTELENIAKIELQSSPNIKHSPIYLNKAFSKSNLQTLIAQNDSPIIHLATHGILIRPNSDGYVQLGTTQSASLTNRLTASEIRQLNGLQNKELLVFSACQTVLSIGNISYGLAGAALVAGVKSSTGSCWDVSDEGNMILMTGFYQQLLGEGLSKTKALQKTQKAMLLKMVETTPVDGTTDKAELSINGIKVESSEYGQRNIKRLGNNPKNYLDHPFYWCGTFLLGNPW